MRRALIVLLCLTIGGCITIERVEVKAEPCCPTPTPSVWNGWSGKIIIDDLIPRWPFTVKGWPEPVTTINNQPLTVMGDDLKRWKITKDGGWFVIQ